MGTTQEKFWHFIKPFIKTYVSVKFNYQYEEAPELSGGFLLLANHVTDWDPLLVSVGFPDYVCFVASEHVFRFKFWGKLIVKYLDPIARPKGSVASVTAKQILRKLKGGTPVCMFAEGDRSWDGVTGAISDATVKLVKASGVPLVTYRIEGGYNVSPRWSNSPRKGSIGGKVVRVISAKEIKEMDNNKLLSLINEDLYVDANETQEVYTGDALAEDLETLFYTCPACGNQESLVSSGNVIRCGSCGYSAEFDGVRFTSGKFKTIREWLNWQDFAGIRSAGASGKLISVKNHKETVLYEGPFSMDWYSLTCGDTVFKTEDITSLALVRNNHIMFTHRGEYYEILVPRKENVYKFLVLFNHVKSRN